MVGFRKQACLPPRVLRPDSAYLPLSEHVGEPAASARGAGAELVDRSDTTAMPSPASHVLPNRDFWEA